MINNQLLVYVRQQLSINVGKEIITANLKSGGWTDADINEVFAAIGPSVTPPAPAPVSPIVSPITPNLNQNQVQTAQTDFSSVIQPKSKGKKILAIILGLILLGGAGVGAYAYYSGFFVSFPNLVAESINNTRNTKSGSYDIAVNVDLSELKDGNIQLSQSLFGPQKFSFSLKGSSDFSDSKNLKNSSVVSFDMAPFSLEAELRLIENIFYAKITKFPAVASLLTGGVSYENKWLSFPLNSIPVINANSIDNLVLKQQKDYLYQMIQNAHFIKQTARFSSEVVGGESSFHFAFDLDRPGITAYLKSLTEYLTTFLKDNPSFSSFDQGLPRKALDQIKDFKGEIWIGRSDKFIHRLVLDFGIQLDPVKEEQVKINVVAIFSDYNQPVNVSAPSGSIPYETLLGNTRQKGREAAIKANLSGIRVQDELFYNSHRSSYSGFCESKELKGVRKAVEDAGGTGFICKDKTTAYAIGVKLSDSSGNWCIDSTGVSKNTKTLPSGTVCPTQ